MRALVLTRYGMEDGLRLDEVATPAPDDDEVQIEVCAAGVNDWDWSWVTGKPVVYRLMMGLRRPKVSIIGVDVAGRVAAVGCNVTRFQPGDDVHGDLSESGFGAFAEYVSVPESAIGAMPSGMSYEQAAAIPHAALLAWQGLIGEGQIQHGQHVLINGAGGGVGTFAVQLAKLHSAEVTGVDSAAKLERMRAAGFDHVIDYKEEDFTRNGQRYDLILDAKTTRSPFAHARSLKPGGAYVTVGGALPRLLQTFAFGPLITAVTGKRIRVLALKPNEGLSDVDALFEAGKIAPVIEGPYELSELPRCLRRFGDGEHIGKIIIRVRP